MKIKELKKGAYFKPHLGAYERRWTPPTWQKVEYNKKKHAWICYEIEGRRTAYFFPNEEIKEIFYNCEKNNEQITRTNSNTNKIQKKRTLDNI